ncbi:MAG: hypothetical protein RIC85_06010 [Gammaproteobacteria bacterium]
MFRHMIVTAFAFGLSSLTTASTQPAELLIVYAAAPCGSLASVDLTGISGAGSGITGAGDHE